MFCSKCGANVMPEDDFCGSCGTSLVADKSNSQVIHSPKINPSAESAPDDRNMAILMCIGSIFFAFFPSLIFWLINKDKENKMWISDQSKAMLNFQITLILAYLVSAILTIIIIGGFLAILVSIFNVVICILAAVKVSKGDGYKYPLSLYLLK